MKPTAAALPGRRFFPSERGSRIALGLLLLGIFLAGSSIRPVVPADDGRRSQVSPPRPIEVLSSERAHPSLESRSEAHVLPLQFLRIRTPFSPLWRAVPKNPAPAEQPAEGDSPRWAPSTVTIRNTVAAAASGTTTSHNTWRGGVRACEA